MFFGLLDCVIYVTSTDMDIAFASSVLKICFMLIVSLLKKFDISMRTEKCY